MISFTLELSKCAQTFPVGGMDCAEFVSPNSLLHILIQDAHVSTSHSEMKLKQPGILVVPVPGTAKSPFLDVILVIQDWGEVQLLWGLPHRCYSSKVQVMHPSPLPLMVDTEFLEEILLNQPSTTRNISSAKTDGQGVRKVHVQTVLPKFIVVIRLLIWQRKYDRHLGTAIDMICAGGEGELITPSPAPAIEIHSAHIIADELVAHFVSRALNCSKLRTANLNFNTHISIKFFFLWSAVAFSGDHIGSLSSFSMSITLPWYPGVYNYLIGEAVHSQLAYQKIGEVLITACAPFLQCLCTRALDLDHHGIHLGAHHLYIAYILQERYVLCGRLELTEGQMVQSLLCSLLSLQQKLGCGFHAGSTTGMLGCDGFPPVLQEPTATSQWLWDPGGSSRRPAWGQAGFQGGECHGPAM